MNATERSPRPQAPPSSSRPLRLAAVSYLNTLPLIEGLEKLRGVELTLAPPSDLIGLLLSGAADAALAPIIDAQRSPEPLALIPAGGIGCDGPTMTVRLSSAVPFERITTVHADSESHTSVALVRILLHRLHGVAPRIVEFDARASGDDSEALGAGRRGDAPQATLVIGDKVVTNPRNDADYPHQMDLGQTWKTLTGLPFVYAAWMCPASRADQPEIRAAAAVLDRQRRHNAQRLDWIAARRAPEHGWPVDLARDYLGRMLRYDVGEQHRAAIEAFFDAAASLGLIERRPTIWSEW